MKIKVVNKSNHPLPEHATKMSAGIDLKANIVIPVILHPMERRLIQTGLFIQLPKGYEAQIRPRSGLAIKNGITVLNSPGTVDADYRGEIGVILINLSPETFVVYDGDRIAQMTVSKYKRIEWVETDSLDDSERGKEGFGHTGIK
jgi:dUTP pyrophosphatase